MIPSISREEFAQRVRKTQELMVDAGLDILLTYGNEAEPQYVRYYSNYWPSFESAMVLIPLQGDPILLIGPESMTLAEYWSVIPRIERLKLLRESSEPEYPGEKLNTLYNLFGESLKVDSNRRIGLCGYPMMYAPVYKGICEAASAFGCEVVRSEQLVIRQKMIKTPQEIEIMRFASKIAETACIKVIENLRPGMSETQAVGIAEDEIRQLGAENEAFPMWVLTGHNTTHAIGRPDPNRIIHPDDFCMLQFGARVNGYSTAFGRPVIVGKVPDHVRDLVEIGLEAHLLTVEWVQAGVPAREAAQKYNDFLKRKGAEGANLYGPCHGTGMMEGEHPWVETNSDYVLMPGMTFMNDTFLKRNGYGLRWEDQILLTENGTEMFTDAYHKVIEI